MKKTISRFPRLQHTIIVAALVAPLLSLTAAPAHAVAATCAEGGVCQVGDIGPGGGIVFYVAPTTFTQIGASGTMCTTNCKYLEAAPNTWTGGSSDPIYSWTIPSNQSSAVTGADGAAIGSGYQNSVDMLAQSNNVISSSAAVTAARAFTAGSKSDWYLPSIEEFAEMVTQKTLLQLSSANAYWTSSEDISNAGDANFVYIGPGGPIFTRAKSNGYLVRPIRAFAPATKISITRAAVGTQRGTAFTTQPQITIQYTNDDTATVSSAVVTASISSGGTLVGTTMATASSGVATFSNLGVDGTVGTTYTISYTALDLPIASATVTLTGTTCNGSTFVCQVGDIGPGGGIIFYVAPNNGTFTQIGASGTMCTTYCKYLEAAPNTWSGGSSDPLLAWASNVDNQYPTTAIEGADGTAIGTGYKNSLDIAAQTSNVAASSAAVAVRGYNSIVSGTTYTDWFLPSKDELNQLFLQNATVGGFVGIGLYWSSSEYEPFAAYRQYFGDGSNELPDFKWDRRYVRPIRAFGVAPTTISVFAIGGVTAPVRGGIPVNAVTAANGYTGTVTWSGAPTIFAPSTVYTATITLTADTGYTLVGVGANSFTVAGATSVTHSYDSGLITAVFAATGADPIVQEVRTDPMLPITRPQISISEAAIMCSIGTYSQRPSSSVFSLFEDGRHIGTIFSAVGDYLPDWIIPWATSTTITRTATLTSASWVMSEAYQGKSITCSVLAYSNHATGLILSDVVVIN